MRRTTINFGTVKGDSLSINTLASNNCLCHRNVFQNGVSTFSKLVNNISKKSQNFVYFLTKGLQRMKLKLVKGIFIDSNNIFV